LIPEAFPCRIGLWLTEPQDRDIIVQDPRYERPGAGEIALILPSLAHPVSVETTFVSSEEVERVAEWYAVHSGPKYDTKIAANIGATLKKVGGQAQADEQQLEHDPLFRQAAEVCIQNELGSTSLLQRRMRIGYGRAVRILDRLEMAGVVGPANGTNPRTVLVTLEELDHISEYDAHEPSRVKSAVRSARGKGTGCLSLLGIIAAACAAARIF
jgi:S-DNA-T family DNA segregation ATPase FtsK/SpoIIIE